jgi:hypothetical protein
VPHDALFYALRARDVDPWITRRPRPSHDTRHPEHVRGSTNRADVFAGVVCCAYELENALIAFEVDVPSSIERSGTTLIPCPPSMGGGAIPARSTEMPARRSTSTIVTASSSSNPVARRTTTFIGLRQGFKLLSVFDARGDRLVWEPRSFGARRRCPQGESPPSCRKEASRLIWLNTICTSLYTKLQ